jgi:hypothetical protein
MSPERNSNWQQKVRFLRRRGYGVEDIAVMHKCDVAAVRAEVSILRQEGRLAEIVKPVKT